MLDPVTPGVDPQNSFPEKEIDVSAQSVYIVYADAGGLYARSGFL
jgi:hypothetical protein